MTIRPIEDIYAPIREELQRVEQCLGDVAQVDYAPLGALLGHILANRGKRVRPALTLLSGQLQAPCVPQHVHMAAAIELLHTATLLHDDTIDRAAARRGQPTVNALWSGGIAVLAGDYLFAKAAELIASIGSPALVSLFAQAIITICRGELEQDFSDFAWRRQRENYYRRIGLKTASLFAAAAESGALLGGANREGAETMRRYGHNLGMAFQIVDDLLDLTGEAEELGKPVGSDLLQGTLTLPVILYLEGMGEETDAIDRDLTPEEAEQLVARVRASSAIAASQAIAEGYVRDACRELARYPQGEARRSLEALARYVVERRK